MTISAKERTLASIKEMGESKLYTMTYYADYQFDSLLEKGVESDADFYHLVSGVSKLIEYVNGEMIVNTTNLATNFYVSPIQNGFGHGYDRYDILQQTWNASGGILTEKDCMTLLQKVAQDPGTCLTSETQWSVVYNLDQLKAKVAVRRNYNEWFDF